MEELIFEEPRTVLDEAITRHESVWPLVLEGIQLAHLAYPRRMALTESLVPGIPCLRRARNELNDDTWRFIRSICDPLLESGQIRTFSEIDGGEVLILPDGLHARVKKGDVNGKTSNYPTDRIRKMGARGNRYAMYPGQSSLDLYIEDGLWIDVVYVAGISVSEITQMGIRLSVASVSPFVSLPAPDPAVIGSISPKALELSNEFRSKIQSA